MNGGLPGGRVARHACRGNPARDPALTALTQGLAHAHAHTRGLGAKRNARNSRPKGKRNGENGDSASRPRNFLGFSQNEAKWIFGACI